MTQRELFNRALVAPLAAALLVPVLTLPPPLEFRYFQNYLEPASPMEGPGRWYGVGFYEWVRVQEDAECPP